ncbi:MAG: hypothetical protein R3C01_01775 [Planctomycetaceae bacterium]
MKQLMDYSPCSAFGRRLTAGIVGCFLLAATTVDAADFLPVGPTEFEAVHAADASVTLLPEARCLVFAPHDIFGTQVRWTASSFVHVEHPQHQVDCQVQVRLQQSHSSAGWRSAVMSARTDISQNLTTASVTAVSEGAGSALFGLQVAFIPRSGPPLAAGRYVTRLVGTISAP